MRCAACHTEIARPGRFCPECAAPLAPDDNATATMGMRHRPPSSSSSSAEDGRFPPGSLLGERYRVVALVGRGGMGEVYRASDLKLNQGVALKFLPAAIASRPGLLERFHGEVRIARQVSHPNVCRVYDIGEIEGSAFISMEYVDGEDLGSLLRRIGRLPNDKAIEIARKLCAGLAAAHAKGVLHRDLKPANIMIDGRGQVLIMDFGLAAVADQVAGAEVRNGTPAYMAPEQLAGKEVSERSDIYALGLVLYEVFTGQKAYKTTDRSSIPSAVSIVRDVDPAIERVIARCLDPDPAKRPQSALALARMLPGGDPLAEALAAGDTPTPAMVAASEEIGALSVRSIVACMAVIVLGLAVLVFGTSRNNLVNLAPFPYSPEVLSQKAQEIAARLGYLEAPVDRTERWAESEYIAWAEKNLKPEEYRRLLPQGQPATHWFIYNQSPRYITPADPFDYIRQNDSSNVPGLIAMRLDPQGRLVGWRAIPPPTGAVASQGPSSPGPAMDWNKVFEAAGLDRSQWAPAESQQIPESAFDQRAAWTGTYPGAPNIPLRIEAAAWGPQLVAFAIAGPWTRAPGTEAARTTLPLPLILLITVIYVSAILLALRNLRTGRGDQSGATRLAVFVFVCLFANVILVNHHTPTISELGFLIDLLGFGLFLAGFVWAMYMALEPFVRRHWPQALISWTRLLSGDIRNPVVAGHVLVGMAAAAGVSILFALQRQLLLSLPASPIIAHLDPLTLIGNRWFGGGAFPTAITLGLFFFLFVARLLLRRTWLAAAAMILFVGLTQDNTPSATAIAVRTLADTALILSGVRFGLLPMTLVLFFEINSFPFTTNISVWYAKLGWLQIALTLGVAVWAFRNALGGRKIWTGEFLDR